MGIDNDDKGARARHVTPPVCILLATHNGARFLGAQLDSLLAQGYPNLRIIALGGASELRKLR